ncbi:MAG: MFS transporter, partial [Rhizobacter sp.]
MLSADTTASPADAARLGATAASPARVSGWIAVLSLAVGSFATVTTEFLPIGVLPLVASSLGVTEGTAGLMVTMPGIVAALAG